MGMDIVPFTRFLYHSMLCPEKVVFVRLRAGLKVTLKIEQK